jgi:type IV pilus assembly protein PilA
MKKNNKGFTLIELLVVVAIIGILAAVGVTAYSGYTASARAQAAKTNHATIAKYIAAETTKCELGEATVMAGQLTCGARGNVGTVGTAVTAALADFSNPWRTQDPAIVNGAAVNCATGTTAAAHSLGRTYVNNTVAGVVTITTCWQVAVAGGDAEEDMENTFRVDGN